MKNYIPYFVPMNTGAKDVLYRVRTLFIPYVFLLCACLVIKLLYTRSEIYFAVNKHYTDFLDSVEPYITHLGDGWTMIVLAALLLLFSYRAALLTITSYAVTALTAQVLKYLFDFPRPRIYFQDQLSKIHFVKGLYILAVHSFPSGHTVTAFSMAMVVTYLVKNKNWGFAMLVFAMMVGYSRMYLSQHFFEDVMAGSAIGVFVTLVWLTFLDSRKFINSPGWCRGLLNR
ncbi:MAG: phosphatase PAP2 family protein [Mucilaginibacter sp.]|nr:phosphatase PAP2 family protein [Mucilaginibacter sp.]